MSAINVTAREQVIPKYPGEIQDYLMQWTGRIAPARTSAAMGTGAWTVVGETASAFNFYAASGLSASAVSTTAYWSAWNTASGDGLTATGSASAMYALYTRIRMSGGSASTVNYTCSAELRTSSGRFLFERFHIQIG
jgi:hypothetical protein